MPDIPAEDLTKARAIIDQLHERLAPLAAELTPDADMALAFDPEKCA